MPRKEPRNYTDEYNKYHGKPEQIKNRAARVQARRDAEKDGKVRKGDGKHVDHKDGNPRNNAPSNKRVVNAKTNLRKGSKPLR